MGRTTSFFVPGIPQPQGSKQLFNHQTTEGGRKPVMVEDARLARPWRQAIRSVLLDLETECSFGEVTMEVVFTFPRPLSHFGTGANAGVLKPKAAVAPHINAPDVDKLIRAVCDALTGTLYHDDRQITEVKALKQYGAEPGARITVWAA